MEQIRPYYAYTRPVRPRLIVIHTMEAGEHTTTAENVARWCALPSAQRGGSVSGAHYYVDNDSIVRGADDNQYTYCAKGANHQSLHIEQAGYARQTTQEWGDPYSSALITNTARCVAEWSQRWGIPIKRLSPQQVANHDLGVCGHYDITLAFKKGSHTDPGPQYPWYSMLSQAQSFYNEAQAKPTTEGVDDTMIVATKGAIEVNIFIDTRNPVDVLAIGGAPFATPDTHVRALPGGGQAYRSSRPLIGLGKATAGTVALMKDDRVAGRIRLAPGWAIA